MYTTGSKALDALFGGYYPKVLHTFYGGTAMGKTTLTSYIPIGMIHKSLSKPKSKALLKGKYYVVDGDGGFDFERAEQIWKGMGIADPNEIFDRLVYWDPTTFEDQHKIITREIDDRVKAGGKPLVLIADPMTAIYRGIILRTNLQYRMVRLGDYTGKLDLQLVTLRRLGVKHNAPVVVSSWPGSSINMSGTTPETPVIGGRAFGYIPKVIVGLSSPIEGSLIRQAYLYKHRSKPSGRTCYFKLVDAGIDDLTKKDLAELNLK